MGEHSALNSALKTQYDFTRMWDITLKVTNRQTRQTSKQKLTDVDNTVVVTRGEGGGVEKGKGRMTCGDVKRPDFGWRAHSAIIYRRRVTASHA